jgi:hypothetical protein
VGLAYGQVSNPSTTSLTTGSTTSPSDPIQSNVMSPTVGAISISTALATGTSLPGYTTLNQYVQISAPTASTSAPLTLTFTLDASAVNGTSPSAITVFQNGVAVPMCTSTSPTIAPDPCESSATLSNTNPPGIGDVVMTVLTSSASIWGFGVSRSLPPPPPSTGLHCTTTSLLPGVGRTEYSATLTSSGGNPPYKWSVSSGKLPKGLHLDKSTGVISGRPKKADSGTYTFTVKVVDKRIKVRHHPALRNTATKVLSITIS